MLPFRGFKHVRWLKLPLINLGKRNGFTKIPTDEKAGQAMPYEDIDSEDGLLSNHQTQPQLDRRTTSTSRIHSYSFLGHFILVCTYTVVFFVLVSRGRWFHDVRKDIVHSPANSIVEYESKIFNPGLCLRGPFSAEPSEESDRAWSELVENAHVRISGEDLRRINKTSIPLPDEEDTYWGTLGVIHELHCLKRIRQYVYKDHYFPDLSPHQEMLNHWHTRHCIEILRQAAMCRGDVSLITMFWSDDTASPVADFNVPHSCVNFDAIQDWAKERAFNPMKPGYLRHPTLGASFADGHSHDIGVAEQKQHDGLMSMEDIPKSCH